MMAEYTNRFWLRAIEVASKAAQRRLLKSFEEYMYAVVEEASDRNGGHIRGTKDYLELARLTGAIDATYFLVELGLDIPDEVMSHPDIQSLRALAGDALLLINVRIYHPSCGWTTLTSQNFNKDLYSYNIEQASGHGGHNLLTVVMNEKGVDLNGAIDWLAEYHAEVLSKFQAQYQLLPSWGPDLDPIVANFVERLAYSVRGIDAWHFESERYFGTKGLDIQKHRLVTLLPMSKKLDVTPIMALTLPSALIYLV